MSRSQAALVSTTIRRQRSIETCQFEGARSRRQPGRADVRDVGFSDARLCLVAQAESPMFH